ncbi:MAG: DUF4340 domain-containing protein [Leptolyngbyaceae cyanobacterium CRU_2_3]|nr:DUF4340 domain-containing protein [Leptolyngbyaceae cyanobacterium CRU_2_3]
MKLKPSTLFLILAALALGGVVLIVQSQVPVPQPGATASDPKKLFSFQESQIQTLTLQTQIPQTQARSLKFQRDKDGKWQMLEPEKATANDASMSFLLNLLATGQSQRSFSVPASDREQYGFQQPLATLEVTLDNKETHQLVLGSYDFNRSNLYALVDPPTDAQAGLNVRLVPPTFETAIRRPVEEWKQTPASKAAPDTSPLPTPAVSPPASPPANGSPTVSPLPSPTDASPRSEVSPSPETVPLVSPTSPASPASEASP